MGRGGRGGDSRKMCHLQDRTRDEMGTQVEGDMFNHTQHCCWRGEPSSTGSIQLSWIPILWIPYKMLILSISWGVGYILFLIFCFFKSKVLFFLNKICLHSAFEAALNAEAGLLYVNDIDKHISRVSFKNKRIKAH